MANTIGTAVLELTTDDTRLRSGLRGAEQATRGWLGMLQTAVGTALGFAGAIVGLEAVGAAVSFAQESVFGLNNRLQQATIAFTTMLGSGEKAQAFLNELARFAARTPFEFPDLVTATQRMMAYGFEAKQVIPLLTAVGNASAALGLGAEGIDRVTTALGQMRAKGKVSGEEMRQLAEAGIPAWDMLARKLGVDVATAMKQVEDRAVDANVMIEAFMEGVGERFPGMMEKQSRTFAGAMSTIKDSLQMATATAFRPFFDLVTAGLVKLADILSSEAFQQFAQRVAGGIQGLIDRAREFLPTLQQFVASFAEPGAVSGLLAILNPLGALAREVLPALLPLFQALGQAIAQIVTTVGPPFAQLIGTVGAILRDAIAQVLPSVVSLVQQLAPAFAQVFAALAPLIAQGLQVLVSALLPPLIDMLTRLVSWLANNETMVKILAGALVALIVVMNPIPAAILGIIAAVGFLSRAWDDIKSKTLDVWNNIRDFLTRNWQEILSIAAAILLGPVGLVALFTTNAFGIRDRVTEAFRQLVGGVSSVLSELLDQLRGLPGRIVDALGNLGGLLVDAGRELIRGLIRGIREAIPSLEDVVGGIGGLIKRLKGPLPEDRRLLVPEGAAIVEGLMAGIASRLPDLRGLMTDVTGALALGGLGTPTPRAGITRTSVSAPITVNVYGLQPDDVERSILRAQRRLALEWGLR